MTDINKFERLIYILNLLLMRRNLTAEKLANYCGVSIRTIFRDIDSLTKANVPLYYDSGYKLLSDYLLPRINFSAKEYRLLSTALGSSPLNNIGDLRSVLNGIQVKVDAAVPKTISGQNGFHNGTPKFVVHSDQLDHKSMRMFRITENAIVSSNILSITYVQGELRKKTVTVNPYLNCLKNGLFVLLGIESTTSKVFQISYRQIERCRRTDRKFTYREIYYDKILSSLKSSEACSMR